jgi:hypothetical protein
MVTTMSLPVRSDVADPLERLRAVHGESEEAKRLTRTVGASLLTELAHFLPSTTSGLMATAYGRYGLAERLPPIFNTVITNVPGPNFPLYSMGSKMVANFGLGPITHGIGLFQPVIGYNGQITVSAISCRAMMPDPGVYCDYLAQTFDDLKKAAKKPKKRMASTKAKKKKAKTNGAGRKTTNGSGRDADSDAATGKKTTRKRKSKKRSGKARPN